MQISKEETTIEWMLKMYAVEWKEVGVIRGKISSFKGRIVKVNMESLEV